MLDIEIFSVDKPIYQNGKKIGEIPHLVLGQYAPLESSDKQAINLAYTELSASHHTNFEKAIHKLGQLFFASTLIYQIQHTLHPLARQQMFNLLKQVHPETIQSREILLQQQQALLTSLHQKFQPIQMIAMMKNLTEKESQKRQNHETTPIQDEIFARGISKCTQSIRDLPTNDKTPLIQKLCKRSTHRGQPCTYSRS